jgi:hypothetical protein
MRVLLLATFVLFSLCAFCLPNNPEKDSKFEFTKSVYKVKGVVNKANDDMVFVILPQELKGKKFVPTYLPEEYKKKGLEVTFDGDLGKEDKAGVPLTIHKIWVAYEIKEKFKLAHKNYDLN